MGYVYYDGVISGGAIAVAIATVSGANLVSIPYANGMRVMLVGG